MLYQNTVVAVGKQAYSLLNMKIFVEVAFISLPAFWRVQSVQEGNCLGSLMVVHLLFKEFVSVFLLRIEKECVYIFGTLEGRKHLKIVSELGTNVPILKIYI